MRAGTNTPEMGNFFSLPGAGRAQQILGVRQIYKAEAHQTGGNAICVELDVPPGQGIPPHRHSEEDEAFYVVSGQITIAGEDCGTAPVRLDAGSFFYGPRGRIHGFHNTGPEAAKLVIFITPGSRMEAMFAELAVLTAKSSTIDPSEVAAICGQYGITFMPP